MIVPRNEAVCVSVLYACTWTIVHTPQFVTMELRGKITTKVNLYYNWAVGVPAKWGNGVPAKWENTPM